MAEEYEPVIALEMHAQLKTASKMFCACSASYGGPPNSQVCPICLGMPGTLPVLNRRAVEFAIRLVLATGGTVHPRSIFARKNYFYPDLPKGYQISQYESPLATGGMIAIDTENGPKNIGLIRIHLEEDAGKSMHQENGESTFVDFNRCGVPLIEIVSKPDLRSPAEGHNFLLKLKQLVEYLDICTGNMEEGSLRCDANISIRPKGAGKFGTRCELKNMNSFRGVERALNYEIMRQSKVLAAGGAVEQQTLLWDEKSNISLPMRSKEESHDYRYFPEPDLMYLDVTSEWIEQIRNEMPELPSQRRRRFIEQYGLPAYDAEVLTSGRPLADYFESAAAVSADPKLTSNWIMTELMREIKETDIARIRVTPESLGELLLMIKSGEISGKIAKDVFGEMLLSGKQPRAIVTEGGLTQISDESLIAQTIERIISANPDNVKKYLSGKEGVFGFFVGQVMKETGGKANPALVNKLLRAAFERLGKK